MSLLLLLLLVFSICMHLVHIVWLHLIKWFFLFTVVLFFFYNVWCNLSNLQLQWGLHPICFLPESLRGIQISDLNIGSLEVCTAAESLHDETFDAASTSHNFLTRGKLHFLFRSLSFSLSLLFLFERISSWYFWMHIKQGNQPINE